MEPAQPFIALGVLSSAITYETGRTVAAKCLARRDRIREATRRFANLDSTVVMRFLLAANFSQRASLETRMSNAKLYDDAHREAALHNDIIFLNMTESFHLCAWKKLMWYQLALIRWPAAQFFAIADDDSFVQIAHLEADMRSIATRNPYVL